MDDLIKPGDLQKVAAEKEMARAREIAEADKRRADERHQLQEAFMNRHLHPDVKARVSTALRAAAERGETHLRVMTFSSEFCTDGGRAINNGDPNWPKTLVGFAADAYEFYQKELQPHGYRLRAEILDFPGGMPGEVGITLSW
jgi:hypothetical protein